MAVVAVRAANHVPTAQGAGDLQVLLRADAPKAETVRLAARVVRALVAPEVPMVDLVQVVVVLVAHPARNGWSKWRWGLMAIKTASSIARNWDYSRQKWAGGRANVVGLVGQVVSVAVDPVDQTETAVDDLSGQCVRPGRLSNTHR
jgi:hypothetical protein